MPLDPSKIQALLETRKMSRADLARETGIKPPHVSRMLAAPSDPLLSTAEKVAKALRCTIARITQ